MVECLHHCLKEALKARLDDTNDWMDHLPWVLLSLRTTIKDDIECAPSDMVYGAPLTIPGDCLPTAHAPKEEDFVRGLRETVKNL